jgi:hypothetical protein
MLWYSEYVLPDCTSEQFFRKAQKNSIIDSSLPAILSFYKNFSSSFSFALFRSSLLFDDSIRMDINSPKNNEMEELDESAGEALVVAVPTIASSPVTAEPSNMDVATSIEPPANVADATGDYAVATDDTAPHDTTAPVDAATGCECQCQQCLYARDINSGLCCCYHCLHERDQQSRQRRDTASVATNPYHQPEVAWEVYNDTHDLDDYEDYVNCCLLAEEEGNYYNEDDEEEEDEEE